MKTVAFGDVHGRLDLLRLAFDKIDQIAEAGPTTIIALGDYIDRGPDSAGVVDFLMSYAGQHRLVCLKGNHEDLMVQAKSDGGMADCWMMNGGIQTLRSYEDGLPSEVHREWMRTLPVTYEDRHRVYVHAGLMPGFDVDQQEDEWCLWIRERFLREKTPWSKHVVHGHTPQHDGKPNIAEPELLFHRTNLDTGAYYTGVLTMAVFNDEEAGGPVEVVRIENSPQG